MSVVTVIIPYYKKKKFIKDAIQSVINQSYKSLKVILIYDDEDQTDLQYINKLKLLDKRISIIINRKNLGAGFSRNKGINNSKGKYIAFIDADDIWKKNKLALQIEYMKKKNILISHTSYSIINEKNTKIIGTRIARDFYNIQDLLKSCDIGLSTVLLDRKIFSVNSIRFPKMKTKEDFVLWLMILKSNKSIYALNKNLTLWRKSKNSLSSSNIQKITDGFMIYYKFMNYNLIKSLYYLICLCMNFFKKQ